MKSVHGWWFPDHEKHLTEWMSVPANRIVINERVAYQGKKQLAAIALARQRRAGVPLHTAVDVGGHVGLWSYNLAHAFGRVIAFEPVEELRRCFSLNVTADNVTVEPVALGATAGSVSMHTSYGSTGDSWVSGAGDIPMRTLDSYELTRVDLIKIDCEGYEQNVVAGAEMTIRLKRPVIIVEQKRDMATRFRLEPMGAVKLLHSWGYRTEREIGGDFLMVPA